MTSAHQLLAEMSGRLWPALLDHLWQGTLFAGVAWLFCLLAKRASSKTRYGIWLMASLKFAVPAILFVWVLAPLDIQVPWPREVLSSSSARVVTEFPLTTELEEQAVVIGPLERVSRDRDHAYGAILQFDLGLGARLSVLSKGLVASTLDNEDKASRNGTFDFWPCFGNTPARENPAASAAARGASSLFRFSRTGSLRD